MADGAQAAEPTADGVRDPPRRSEEDGQESQMECKDVVLLQKENRELRARVRAQAAELARLDRLVRDAQWEAENWKRDFMRLQFGSDSEEEGLSDEDDEELVASCITDTRQVAAELKEWNGLKIYCYTRDGALL